MWTIANKGENKPIKRGLWYAYKWNAEAALEKMQDKELLEVKEDRDIIEYIITGQYPTNGRCMITICGHELEDAKKTLLRMKTEPTDNDLALIGEASDLRVDKITSNLAWWNDPELVR